MVNEVESVLGLGVLTVSVYLGAVAATLCSGLLKNTAATLICLVVQCVAMWYYTLSYIPFAQTILGKCIKAMCQ